MKLKLYRKKLFFMFIYGGFYRNIIFRKEKFKVKINIYFN